VRPASSKGGNESVTERNADMSVWSWLIVGASAYLVLSVVVAVALSATLRRIGHNASDLLEPESRATAALARKEIQEEQEALAEWMPLSERLSARVRSLAGHVARSWSSSTHASRRSQ
jgi:hypothetical protein